MIRQWLKNIPGFLSANLQMTVLAWQTQRIIFSSLILLEMIQGFVPIATAWITKEIFDLLILVIKSESADNFTQDFALLLLIQTCILIADETIRNINTYFNAELGRQLQIKTQAIIYERVTNLHGLAYFENPEFHDTLKLASQGIYSGPTQILQTFTTIIRSSITLFSFWGALFFLSPSLALLIILASLPQLVAQLKIGKQRFGIMFMNTPKERLAMYFGQILSTPHFAKEVRLFKLKDYFLNRFLEEKNAVNKVQRQQQLKELRWQFGLGFLSNVTRNVAFIIVVFQAVKGHVTVGDVTLYASALTSVQGSIAAMVFAFANLNESVLFFSRYTDLMALPPALTIAKPSKSVPALQTGIEFRNVSFRYTEQHPWVLNKINLTFRKGQCLALVGLNGAGKTTIVKLLTRLYDPTEGQILWDGIDIREFEPTEYRQHIGAIFQDFVHYDLTVQENIGLGNVGEITNLTKIQQVAKRARVHDFVQDLENGYQSILSRWLVEDGLGIDLSGGQWQKIAIARMFMRDANLLILDEPTSALDAETEYEIYRHFADLVKKHTSLLISHRFSTVRIADTIAVLEDGKITEYGTHGELLSQGRTYAKFFTMQAEQYHSAV